MPPSKLYQSGAETHGSRRDAFDFLYITIRSGCEPRIPFGGIAVFIDLQTSNDLVMKMLSASPLLTFSKRDYHSHFEQVRSGVLGNVVTRNCIQELADRSLTQFVH